MQSKTNFFVQFSIWMRSSNLIQKFGDRTNKMCTLKPPELSKRSHECVSASVDSKDGFHPDATSYWNDVKKGSLEIS